jgi:hypothetical protein
MVFLILRYFQPTRKILAVVVCQPLYLSTIQIPLGF